MGRTRIGKWRVAVRSEWAVLTPHALSRRSEAGRRSTLAQQDMTSLCAKKQGCADHELLLERETSLAWNKHHPQKEIHPLWHCSLDKKHVTNFIGVTYGKPKQRGEKKIQPTRVNEENLEMYTAVARQNGAVYKCSGTLHGTFTGESLTAVHNSDYQTILCYPVSAVCLIGRRRGMLSRK